MYIVPRTAIYAEKKKSNNICLVMNNLSFWNRDNNKCYELNNTFSKLTAFYFITLQEPGRSGFNASTLKIQQSNV